MSGAVQIQKLIPFGEIAEAMDCQPRTLERACSDHGVPITRLTRNKRGLTLANYSLLLARTSSAQEPA